MDLRPLEIFHFFQCGDRLYTSESDVYRRQILTYKDGPRNEGVDTRSQQIVESEKERVMQEQKRVNLASFQRERFKVV